MNAAATMNTTQTIDALDAIAHASRIATSLEGQRERRTREDQTRRQTVELFQSSRVRVVPAPSWPRYWASPRGPWPNGDDDTGCL